MSKIEQSLYGIEENLSELTKLLGAELPSLEVIPAEVCKVRAWVGQDYEVDVTGSNLVEALSKFEQEVEYRVATFNTDEGYPRWRTFYPKV